jgi:Zn-dependent peptidase ImmA (M78 family)
MSERLKKFLEEMTEEQKRALEMHELLHALLNPRNTTRPQHTNTCLQECSNGNQRHHKGNPARDQQA